LLCVIKIVLFCLTISCGLLDIWKVLEPVTSVSNCPKTEVVGASKALVTPCQNTCHNPADHKLSFHLRENLKYQRIICPHLRCHSQTDDLGYVQNRHGKPDKLIAQNYMNNPCRAVTSTQIPNGQCQIIRWTCHVRTAYPVTRSHIQWLNKHRPIQINMSSDPWDLTKTIRNAKFISA
jgi:hypothetical protein